MGLILLLLAFLAECVATMLGFKWFGTTQELWPGFAALGLALYFLSLLAGANWRAVVRRPA